MFVRLHNLVSGTFSRISVDVDTEVVRQRLAGECRLRICLDLLLIYLKLSGYGLDDRAIEVRSPAKGKGFLL
jgi:hypothetical protein